MNQTSQISQAIPDSLRTYLNDSVDLSWQKVIHPLPAWFTNKEAVPLNKLDPESLLRLLKAKAEGFIRLSFATDWSALWSACQSAFVDMGFADEQAAREQWPTIEVTCRRQLLHQHKVEAEREIIATARANFATLLSPAIPVDGPFLLIEPGLKSGLKIACCDPDASLRCHMILFPHEPQNQWQQGIRKLENCIASNRVESIILITGEGYRESRQFIKEWLAQTERPMRCYRLSGSFKKQLVQQNLTAEQDALYAAVDAFIPLALTPEKVLSAINLKSLFHNPLLTIVNQAQLSAGLAEEWHDLSQQVDQQPMQTDPLFHTDVRQFDELKKRTSYVGQVINKTDYGYFIDIGIIENGLLHIKQLAKGQQFAVGEILEVEVLSSNPEKQQYSLTLGGKKPSPSRKRHSKPKQKIRPASNSAMADALKAALSRDN